MAKPSRRQGAKERQEPTAGRPSKPPIDPETAAPREQKVLPVIAALSDPDVKQRSEAATAIADLVEDPRCRKLLRQERLVYVIMQQTVTESNFEVAAAGWAVLRNLVSEEDDGFLLHLYRQDILTPLLSAIRNVCSSQLAMTASDRLMCGLGRAYLGLQPTSVQAAKGTRRDGLEHGRVSSYYRGFIGMARSASLRGLL